MVHILAVPATQSTSARAAFSRRNFRTIMENFAGQPDLNTVNTLCERCKRAGHSLIGPKLQYVPHTSDRGHYFVLVRMFCLRLHSHRTLLSHRTSYSAGTTILDACGMAWVFAMCPGSSILARCSIWSILTMTLGSPLPPNSRR